MFQRKIEYVPIIDIDPRPYGVKWADVEYLRGVIAFCKNSFWSVEVGHALEELRNKADDAKTPDELKGYNEGVKMLKRLLVLPVMAKKVLEMNAATKDLQ